MAGKRAKMAEEGESSNFVNQPFGFFFGVSFWFCKKSSSWSLPNARKELSEVMQTTSSLQLFFMRIASHSL